MRRSCFVFLVLWLLPLCANGFRCSAQEAALSSGGKASPQFQNPVLWEDLADTDVLRVGNVFYYMASNMHYSPGAPILRSFDLVHWEFIGHAVPELDFSPQYNLQDGNAYVKGTWASFLGYRKSNQTFYWGGCIELKKTTSTQRSRLPGPGAA